jgi:hypothetical protein
VSTNIFAHDDEFTMWVEGSGCMQTTGLVEGFLSCPQPLGNTDDGAAGELPANGRQTFYTLHAQGIKRGFSADTTARGCIEVPLQAIEVDGNAGLEFDAKNRNPTARSSSSPGVRIVIEML